MIKKIISSGQTEADQAVLDVAIKLGFPHGGWIPKGRITKTGTLPGKYRLKEMPTDNYSECIEQNIKDSKGTLIISYGKLTGDYDYARKMTLKHKRQLLGIDLNQTIAFEAASLIKDWIQLRHIDVLFVIGQSGNINPDIGKQTASIIEGALILDLMNTSPGSNVTDLSERDYFEKLPGPPKTVNQAVDILMLKMALKDNVTIANMTYGELVNLNPDLGSYIKNIFRPWSGNDELMESCRFVTKNKKLNEDGACFAIIEALWKRLRKTHKIRVVK
ncbi:MAG: putative molybdenum carrier protein [Thermodesulfobacteriota bacterium]|nr:putative molybdenum carrier protein [Thermodesulfobacteriota bacterium]